MAVGGGQNFDLLLILGMKALRETHLGATYWALQRRHPDGRRWIEIGRFATKEIGHLALDAFVAAGHGDTEDFRVEKIRLQPP
jgi:hypothetical protein